jgi:heme oxygenase
VQGNSSSFSSLPGLLELNQCPAFSNNECPFKGAKSAEEVNEKLQQIPASHLDANGTFFKTLEYFHQTTAANNKHGTGTGIYIGSCPVKQSLHNNDIKDWSFDQAMEEYSLLAIIGKLAQEWEDKEDGGEARTAPSSTRSASPATVPTEDITTSDSLRNEPATTTTTTTTTQNEQPRLSDALKSGTAVSHEAAESVHFVKNFIRGKIDRELYGLLVAQLFHLYERLEEALDEHAPKLFAACHFPKELHRSKALQDDVDFWHSTKTPAVSKATQEYIDRIDYLCETNPLLLLAHAYTRYLGDLSGGKILARVAKRALQLQDGEGLAFYEFEHVQSFKLFKDRYRTCLNQLPLTQTQIQDLVQEANVAFLLNMRLFEELDVKGGVKGATIRSLDSVYHSAKAAAAETTLAKMKDKEQAPCPFAKTSTTATTAATSTQQKGGCPWPFILLHDPKTGFQAWQTWLVIGLLLVYLYQCMVSIQK